MAQQLVKGGLNDGRHLVDDFPLCRLRQRNLHALLQTGEARERHAGAVLEHGDHAGRGRIVFLGSDLGRRLGREDLTTEIAAQLLEFVDGRADRRLPDEAHEPRGRLVAVDFALEAARAMVARLHVPMRDHHAVRAGERVSAVTTMPRSPIAGSGLGPICRRGLGLAWDAGAYQHRASFLGRPLLGEQ